MEELKSVIAYNITELRKESGMTQLELAEKLNYSDKAVSKWERAESLPDVGVLKQIADMFEVTVDYLLKSDHTVEKEQSARVSRRIQRNQIFITGISIGLVWLVATVVFFILEATTSIRYEILATCFTYAVPTSVVVWLVFNSVWFNKKRNFLIISLLLWSTLSALFITLLDQKLYLIFVVGIPAQVIIGLWSGIRSPKGKISKKSIAKRNDK